MSGTGSQMREARERMRVTVTEAAAATHLKILVIDAMERDMGTTLATKEDLRVLRIELTQEVALVRKDLENLNDAITLRLGSIVVIALGVLFAALKLTG